MNNLPKIIEQNENFAVIYKPPKMHCTSKEQKVTEHNFQNTLYEWYAALSSPVYDVMHRLDYETHGLVLFAKNEKTYNFFKTAQDNGEFIKEYSAVCTTNNNTSPGFPDPPSSLIIESYFRPYGPGRKLVRPVIEDEKKHKEVAKDRGGFYKTEIIDKKDNHFTVQIKRGFRHQIRCHLCWIGFPILNDPLYSQAVRDSTVSYSTVPNSIVPDSIVLSSTLALRSHALFFPDPENGKPLEFRINKYIE